MPLKHSRCGLSVFCFRCNLHLGTHKSRAALRKVIKVIKRLVYEHSCSSFDLYVEIIRPFFWFVNSFLKKLINFSLFEGKEHNAPVSF